MLEVEYINYSIPTRYNPATDTVVDENGLNAPIDFAAEQLAADKLVANEVAVAVKTWQFKDELTVDEYRRLMLLNKLLAQQLSGKAVDKGAIERALTPAEFADYRNSLTQPQSFVEVKYADGVPNVAFSSLQVSATTATAAVAAGVKSTYNYIGANYTMGAARLFAGYGDGDKSAAGADAKVTRVGATYTMGAVTLLGQYATTQIGTAADRKTTGLRADYALSKRTVSYLGYESYNSGATTANKTNIMSIGVRHNF